MQRNVQSALVRGILRIGSSYWGCQGSKRGGTGILGHVVDGETARLGYRNMVIGGDLPKRLGSLYPCLLVILMVLTLGVNSSRAERLIDCTSTGLRCTLACEGPCGEGCPLYESGDPCCGSPEYCLLDSNGLETVAEDEVLCSGGKPRLLSENGNLTLGLNEMFGSPEFPPRTTNPMASSMPLVSQSSSGSGSSTPYPVVPTAGGTVDLVFGRPLLQSIDFELPFGSAVFRHVRTFAGDFGVHDTRYFLGSTEPNYTFWDWNGVQWMMGENPILLIDAQPKWPDAVAGKEMSERRCYFISDAHHSIPFMFNNEGSDSWYEAPQWFDAIIGHNGTFDADGEWENRPSEFYVWLDHGAYKYTFEPHYGDFLDETFHNPISADDSGWGWPFYGFLKQVEDRQGNKAVMEYCRHRKWPFEEGTNECNNCSSRRDHEYCQSCNERGQLKSVKLYTASEPAEAAWTILYYHQSFTCVQGGLDHCGPTMHYSTQTAHALRSIFAYEGDIDAGDNLDCLTLSGERFAFAGTLKDWDEIDYYGAPDNWTIQAEYTYRTAQPAMVDGIISPYVTGEAAWTNYYSAGLLIRSVVRRRSSGTTDENMTERTTLYRYAPHNTTPYVVRVSCIFEPQTVDAIVEGVRAICTNGINPATGMCSLGTNGIEVDSDYLMTLHNDSAGGQLPWKDPDTGEREAVDVIDFATHYFEYYTHFECDSSSVSAAQRELMEEYGHGVTTSENVGSEASTCGAAKLHIARTGAPDLDGTRRFFFMTEPFEVEGETLDGVASIVWQGHTPFWVLERGTQDFHRPPADQIRHIAIIDIAPALSVFERRTEDGSTQEDSESKRRRVVEMNPASFILRDRTFDYDGNLTGQLGYAESRVYDEEGMLSELRTSAWGSDANSNSVETDGLIYTFDYEKLSSGPSKNRNQLAMTGIKLGTEGEKYILATYEHGKPNRPDLVTRTTRYRVPVGTNGLAGVAEDDTEVTESFYDLNSNGSGSRTAVEYEQHLTKIGRQTGHQGTVWGIQRTTYNTDGEPIWRGVGRTVDPDDPDTGMVDFFVDHFAFNKYGRPTESVLDIETNGAAPGFTRVAGPDLPALELRTSYHYDSLSRPTRIDKPGGRSDWTVYNIETDNGMLETWKYTDVTYPDDQDPYFATSNPVQITRMTSEGQLDAILQVHLTSTDTEPSGDENYDILSQSNIQFDEYGRAVGAEALADPTVDTNGIQTQIAYDGFGNVARERSADGTITRTQRSMRGRVLRVYRGTKDRHLYWRTITPEDEPNDNMVLVEKWYYGDGTDEVGGAYATGQPIERRRYNDRPENQYNENDGASNEDEMGLPTVFQYDCRGREVFSEEYSAEDEPLYAAFTWYDHQDRVRFTAEYDGGEGPAASIDPRDLCFYRELTPVGDCVPAADDILGGGGDQPVSFKEIIYDLAGNVSEERTYDVETGHYYSTYYEYNGKGMTIRQKTPGGPEVVSLYDALGRLALQKSYADGYEIHRVVNEYDRELGNLVAERTFERRADTTAATLDSADDYIARYRFHWYDDSNRLIATADYGTNDSGGHFVNGTEPVRLPQPPESYDDLGSALVTLYGYDDAGRQNSVIDSGGFETVTEYDGLGRVVLVTENATAIDGDPRHTAYWHKKETGQLAKVAAVRNEHFNNGYGGYIDAIYNNIDWDAEDGTLQVTEYLYDAPVVNANTSGVGYFDVSTNGAWIGAVRYPDPITGQPEEDPSVEFTYRTDGQVVERTDARGVTLVYSYDNRDRLSSIEAVEVPEPETGYMNVDTTAVRMEYGYTTDGLLSSATTKDDEGTALVRDEFEYGRYRLLTAVEQHVGTLLGETKRVEYNWDIGSNGYRLAGIVYPGDVGSVGFAYGGAESTDPGETISAALNQVSAIRGPTGDNVASYRYMGQGRLIGRGIGDGMLSVDYDDASGDVTKLDQFGRLLGIVYDEGQTDPLHEFAFGYDRRGNREYVKALTRQLGIFDQYEQSWRYRYDGLNRLTSASRGDLDETGDDFEEGSEVETTLWNLDDLGNWSGDEANSNSFHVFDDSNQDGDFDPGADTTVESYHHRTNESNEIEHVTSGDDDGLEYPLNYGYDDAGNLVFDGRYFFEYDAWNRLATISEPGSAMSFFGDETGYDYYRYVRARPGAVLERFVYDALGRRVWTVDTGCMGEGEAACGEVLLPVEEAGTTTRHTYGSGAAVLAEYDVDSSGTETLQRWFIHGESFPDPLVLVDVTDAGDSPAGVEEYLYYIKDALGSIAALVDTNGEIVERYTYSPYGQTTITDAAGDLLSGLWTQDVSSWYNYDFDGDLDPTDVASLEYCIGYAPESWDCVFAHDYDTNGVVDVADYGYISYRWWVREDRTISAGRGGLRHPEQVYFDSDRDGDLDLGDFAIFAECAGLPDSSGEGGVLVGTTGLIVNTTGFAACLQVFDADQDGTVTAADYAIVSAYLTNPNTPHTYPTGQWSSAYGNPFMWTGQRIDPRTGLYHFWGRSYSPVLGRWMQEDKQGVLAPAGNVRFSGPAWGLALSVCSSSAGTEYGDGLDLYQYGISHPLQWTDPLGLFSILDLSTSTATQLELQGQNADSTMDLVSSILPFLAIFEDRNLELEAMAGLALEGDVDGMLDEYGARQENRIEDLQALSQEHLANVDKAALGLFLGVCDSALPHDFHHGPKKHCVYLGYDENGNLKYVGRTKRIKRRRQYWKGKYTLEVFQEGLTRKQAQAIEHTLISENRSILDNKIGGLSRRHRWYGRAMVWAAKKLGR